MTENTESETAIEYLHKAIEADPQNTAVQRLNQAIHKLQNDVQLKK